MKLLLLLSLIAWAAISYGQDFGSYQYQYNTGNMSRSEIRFLNGTVRGTYDYIDEVDNLKHKVEYTAGSDQGFRIISHEVYDKNEVRTINNNYTPEVEAARDSHLAFQAALRASLPELKEEEEELPPVYIRHVPGPMQKEPMVPILEAMPLQGREIKEAVKEVRRDYPRKVVVVDNIPAITQFGSRSYTVDNLSERQPSTFRPTTSVRPSTTVRPTTSTTVKPPIYVKPTTSRPKIVKSLEEERNILASDIQLVDGFTAEVAEATKQHLARVAAIKAVLPTLEESRK